MYLYQNMYKAKSINIKGKLFHFDAPKIMGIINLSEESFYENDAKTTQKQIITKINGFIKNGAEMIDIGAVSTRPQAKLPSLAEERNRLIPVLKLVRKKFPKVIISIDTVRSKIAEEALKEGADIINDISGAYYDKNILNVVSQYNCPYILTHNLEKSINNHKLKTSNTIKEVLRYFSQRIQELKTIGIYDIIIDPGFGFSKEIQQNFDIIKYYEMLHILELPILTGISRKSMIYKTLNSTSEKSLNGTSVLHSFLISQNCSIFRVHDVREMKEVKMLWEASFN